MPRVMIAPAPMAKLDGEFLRVMRAAGHDLAYPTKAVQLTEADILAQFAGVCAVLAGSEPYTRNVIESLPELKVIARAGVGFDAVDVEAATERGVVVTFAPGTNHDAVAEHTFMLILALAKNLMGQHPLIRQGAWPRHANQPLRGRTLAVLGLGRIGKTVALRGLNFGMNVVAYEPFADAEFVAKHGITMLTFDDALRQGDYVSIHMPLFPQTRRIINKDALALMKPTAYLINTSRGGVIDEVDLHHALVSKGIAGAGLDVFDEEPPAKDNPLLQLPNIVMTAHTAGVDLQSRDDMALSAATSIVRLLDGEWPAEQVVNPEVRSKFRL